MLSFPNLVSNILQVAHFEEERRKLRMEVKTLK